MSRADKILEAKPRLGETEDEFWKGFHDATKRYRTYGSVLIEVPGAGKFYADDRGKFHKSSAIPDKAMYWKELPITAPASSHEVSQIDQDVAKDTVEVWFRPWSKHQDEKLLHSPSGMSWDREGFMKRARSEVEK